ncbi:hypothetical protein ACIBCH_42010 [Amycolatopsis thailandensis]|uniref:hypothetical protein n=1 Tax=Amycolatopsis thailandensis TaxID=589330 RepID=UPI00378E63B3
MDEELAHVIEQPEPVVSNTITPVALMLTRPGNGEMPLEEPAFRSAERMTFLHGLLRMRKPQIELWPTLLATPKTVSRVVLGPFGDTDMSLGHFLRAAQELDVANVYARYLRPPAREPATLEDGLVAQFVYGGIVHIWAGARLDEPETSETTTSYPNPEQQEVIDTIVERLAADPGYRALTRKSDRENYGRTENGELAEAARGEHPVLPPKFVYRVLQAAAGRVDQGARAAYANVEDDLQDLTDELNTDSQYLLISDKTARRHYLRTLLFAALRPVRTGLNPGRAPARRHQPHPPDPASPLTTQTKAMSWRPSSRCLPSRCA